MKRKKRKTGEESEGDRNLRLWREWAATLEPWQKMKPKRTQPLGKVPTLSVKNAPDLQNFDSCGLNYKPRP